MKSFYRQKSSLKCLRSFSVEKHVQKWDYDVVVAGGNIIGASFVANLCKLTGNSLKICLIDNKPPVSVAVCNERVVPDARTYALSPTSISYLQQLNVWNNIKIRSQTYKSMQIWEELGPGLVRFNAYEFDKKELGRIVEEPMISSSLHEEINRINSECEKPIIDLKFGSTITGLNVEQIGLHNYGPAKIEIMKNNEKSIITSR